MARRRAQETASCPQCKGDIAVLGERGTCPSCGMAVRFVDAPERPCTACARPVALPPGIEVVQCRACGAIQPADPGRELAAVAQCPRCRRRIPVPLEGKDATCRHCGTRLVLADTL